MTTRPDQLASPYGADPRVVVEHVETSERRLCYPVDAAEFVATGQWRHVTTLQHDPARDSFTPMPPTGAGQSHGEGATIHRGDAGGPARLATRDRIVAEAEPDNKAAGVGLKGAPIADREPQRIDAAAGQSLVPDRPPRICGVGH